MKRCACRSPSGTSASRRACASRIAAAIAAGSSGSARTAAVAARFVHRLVRRRDDRHAAGHRLRDRHPEALEARRVDGDGRPAVEPCELLVGDEPEPDDVRPAQLGLVAPAGAAGDREQEVAVEQPVGLDERGQVLARLERGDGEHVRPAEVGALPVGAERLLHAGIRDLDPLRRDAEPLDDVAARVLRVDEDEVTGAGRVRVLGAVHRACLLRHPLGVPDRHEVVHGRRADATGLGRIHPVGVVEDVERAQEALERRACRAGSTRRASAARRAAARA